jgi:hypothetical protein
MEKQMSLSLGFALTFLTLAGFVLNTKHLMKLMNIDVSHSVLRFPLAAAALYGSTHTRLETTRAILFAIGIFYVFMGTAGLADKKVGGTLPSGLTNFDIVYHFVVGAAAIWMGARSGRMMRSS